MAGALRTELEAAGIDPLESPLRLLAVAAGVALGGSFLSVFVHLTDVAGGTFWLVLTVGAALLLATVLARRLPVRQGVIPGLLILALGPLGYLILVPELHGAVGTPAFLLDLGAYMTGVTVLRFLRVDVWAIAIAPGPAFLTWYLLLRRRYDLAGVAGGLTLAFFSLTGDAGPLTTLAGMGGLLGMLGIGTIEKEGGSWEQVEQLALVVAVSVFVARLLSIVPDGGQAAQPGGDGAEGGAPIAGDLTSVDAEAEIFDRISLSPTVYFTIDADRPDLWRVAAFDRYTGADWIRTGESAPFGNGRDGPPGTADRNRQTVTIEAPVATMPAAWKPVRLLRGPPETRVTALGGLDPDRSFTAGETYTVVSEVPTRDAGGLRGAGWPADDGVGRFRQLPGSQPGRVTRLAERLTADADSTFAAALAVERWLEGTKGYSLAVDPPSGDLVDGFLFDMDAGYCVYFASAMAVLLRAVGIPARFVLGYATGQRVAETRWVVRGYDSHAWVEVRFAGVGWVPFDPTPAAPRAAAERRQLDRGRSAGRDDVDTHGSEPTPTPPPTPTGAPTGPATPTPVGEQILPGGGVGTEPGTLPSPGRREPSTAAPATGRAGGIAAALAGRDRVTVLAGAASLVLGLHWFRVAERGGDAVSLYRQRPTDDPRLDIERAYDRAERVLARHYRDRREDETPRRYVEVLGHDDVDARARRLVRLYERARYSSEVSRADADAAIDLADAVVAAEGRLAETIREFL